MRLVCTGTLVRVRTQGTQGYGNGYVVRVRVNLKQSCPTGGGDPGGTGLGAAPLCSCSHTSINPLRLPGAAPKCFSRDPSIALATPAMPRYSWGSARRSATAADGRDPEAGAPTPPPSEASPRPR